MIINEILYHICKIRVKFHKISSNFISFLGQITKDVLRIATLARAKTLGPFSPSFNIQKILKDGLEKVIHYSFFFIVIHNKIMIPYIFYRFYQKTRTSGSAESYTFPSQGCTIVKTLSSLTSTPEKN